MDARLRVLKPRHGIVAAVFNRMAFFMIGHGG